MKVLGARGESAARTGAKPVEEYDISKHMMTVEAVAAAAQANLNLADLQRSPGLSAGEVRARCAGTSAALHGALIAPACACAQMKLCAANLFGSKMNACMQKRPVAHACARLQL
jgi:hypothetical protein